VDVTARTSVMSVDGNKAIVRRYVAVINQRDLAALDEVTAAEVARETKEELLPLSLPLVHPVTQSLQFGAQPLQLRAIMHAFLRDLALAQLSLALARVDGG
jgi:hypothetical protein